MTWIRTGAAAVLLLAGWASAEEPKKIETQTREETRTRSGGAQVDDQGEKLRERTRLEAVQKDQVRAEEAVRVRTEAQDAEDAKKPPMETANRAAVGTNTATQSGSASSGSESSGGQGRSGSASGGHGR